MAKNALANEHELHEMTIDDDHVTALLLDALSSAERQDAVAYLRLNKLDAGTTFPASPVPIVCQSSCYLAFIDPTPAANWGHDCRYLVIDAQSFAVVSHPARFPPFHVNGEQGWRIAYRAPGLPDAFDHYRNTGKGSP